MGAQYIKEMKPKIIESTQLEHKQVINDMLPIFDNEIPDSPQLGIFWLDTSNMSLFGVQKGPGESFIKNGKGVFPKLHKTYWQKQHHKAVARGNKDSIFYNEHDYTKIPRGRISFENGQYTAYVGSWTRNIDIDKLTELLEDEFNLDAGFVYKLDKHWDLGHGWSEENIFDW